MLTKSENNILNFIKYAPIVFIILLSLLVTYVLIIENTSKFEKNIENIKKEYNQSKKRQVQLEVQRAYDYIKYKKQLSEEKLKASLKQRVYEAHSIATNIYTQNSEKTQDEILKLIKDALRNIRFNKGRGYYYIYNIKGTNLLYPIAPKLEGSNFKDVQDKNGYFLFRKIIKTIENRSESFDTYYWSKPTTKEKNRIFKKVAFYKYFEPLNISIGTGEYLKDYEDTLKDEIFDYISTISYGENAYIFILDKNSSKYSKIYNEQKNFLITKKILDYSDETNGFLKYTLKYNAIDKNDLEKTTYIKNFYHWDWVIGSGFYQDKLEETIEQKTEELNIYHKKYIYNIFMIISIITLVLLLISIYMSNQIQKRFLKYRGRIYTEIDKNRKKDSLLAQQSKMAAMGEMIGNIAHQWRQPLSLISTVSSGLKLKEELNILEEDDIKSSTKVIIDTTKHLSKTIDDFREFFMPNKEKTFCTTLTLWNKAFSLVKDQYKTKDIIVVTNIKEEEITILLNELIQVILNILNNARDQFENIKEVKKYIFINIYQDKGKLYISIKDSAGGIDKDIIHRVFEPYFTTKYKSQGTGIGLYMSQEIIKKHMDGTIEVSNSSYTYEGIEYKGAEFKIIV